MIYEKKKRFLRVKYKILKLELFCKDKKYFVLRL